MSNNHALLDVSDLSMRFGGLLAVNGVKLDVTKGGDLHHRPQRRRQDHHLQLPDRFLPPERRRHPLPGEEIQGLPGHLIARKGIVRTFQHVRLFKEMTAVENLLVAQHRHLNTGFPPACSRPRPSAAPRKRAGAVRVLAGEGGAQDLANRAAGRPGLRPAAAPLEIARCMATRPELLMLDEPPPASTPRDGRAQRAHLQPEGRVRGVSVLLIEHDMKLVMEISSRIFVVNQARPPWPTANRTTFAATRR